MSYFVYAIKSLKDGSIYVGLSQDVNQRLNEHNNGQTFSTKGHKPYRLIYKEECFDRKSARQREKYWKSGFGKENLKKLFLK